MTTSAIATTCMCLKVREGCECIRLPIVVLLGHLTIHRRGWAQFVLSILVFPWEQHHGDHLVKNKATFLYVGHATTGRKEGRAR